MAGPSKRKSEPKLTSIRIRLDPVGRQTLEAAAGLRRVSVSEYVRSVAVPQAKREIGAARSGTIALTREEQLAFWKALQEPVKFTAAQKQLSKSDPLGRVHLRRQ